MSVEVFERAKAEVKTVQAIVESRALCRAVWLKDKPHAEHRASRQACCWGSPIVVDGFEIAVCQPSPRQKGDERFAFFTFEALRKAGL